MTLVGRDWLSLQFLFYSSVLVVFDRYNSRNIKSVGRGVNLVLKLRGVTVPGLKTRGVVGPGLKTGSVVGPGLKTGSVVGPKNSTDGNTAQD